PITALSKLFRCRGRKPAEGASHRLTRDRRRRSDGDEYRKLAEQARSTIRPSRSMQKRSIDTRPVASIHPHFYRPLAGKIHRKDGQDGRTIGRQQRQAPRIENNPREPWIRTQALSRGVHALQWILLLAKA